MSAKGTLLIIDGPSAVGKSTVVRALLEQQQVHFDLAKRCTTRSKRGVEDDEDIYEFVSHEEFRRQVDAGGFIEHKCYKFGMCYGLPGDPVFQKLDAGNHVLAMINLGNIKDVKRASPGAFGVFVTASLPTIRERLQQRKIHTIEQVEERLGNAASSTGFAPLYDLVVVNERRSVNDVIREILEKFLHHVEHLPIV